MKTLKIITLATVVLLTCNGAFAYVYGYDPAKSAGSGTDIYVELAQNPTFLTSGQYAGKYEYFFDVYTTGGTFYWLDIVGLDNGKIANAHTTRPDGGTFRTQQWGQPMGQYDLWSESTGRIMDLWSMDSNATEGSASAFDYWLSSYDDGAGGWTDAGLAYTWAGADNPHSYDEYVTHSAWAAPGLWKAELTGPGQPYHWLYDQFGVTLSQDTISLVPTGFTFWARPSVGGLVATLRVVYDEPVDQSSIGWGYGGPTYPVLGDFTVIPEPATMSLLALGGLAVLRRRKSK